MSLQKEEKGRAREDKDHLTAAFPMRTCPLTSPGLRVSYKRCHLSVLEGMDLFVSPTVSLKKLLRRPG